MKIHIFQMLKEPVSVILLQYFIQWEARKNKLLKAWLCAKYGLPLRRTSADCKVRNCQMKLWRHQPSFSSVPLYAYSVIHFFIGQPYAVFYPVKQGRARVVNWGVLSGTPALAATRFEVRGCRAGRGVHTCHGQAWGQMGDVQVLCGDSM